MALAGAQIHYPLPSLSSVGLDWIWHIGELRRLGRRVLEICREQGIETLVLVDYPGFNLRVATAARRAGLRVVYYITPQVWAWRTGRVKRMKRDLDRALVILPFEESFLQRHGIPATFVGHPLVDRLANPRPSQVIRAAHGLPLSEEISLVGLLPGSRQGEVHRLLPVLQESARLLYEANKTLHFVVPRAATIPPNLLSGLSAAGFPYSIVENPAPDLRSAFRVCLTKSGTSTLENAILGVPQVILYKGKPVDAWIAKRLIRVPWLGLVNLLAGKEVCPEFLQETCVPEKIVTAACPLLEDTPARKQMLDGMRLAADSLGEGNAAARAARAIHEVITGNKRPCGRVSSSTTGTA
jgi:lipid-A-disaccharide synthase